MRAETPAQIKEQLDVIEAILIDIKDSLSAWCSNYRTDQIRLRQLRNGHFPRHYFSDVAWEIMIDPDQADRQCRLLAVSDLGLDGGIPLSTILRYVQRMEADGYLIRTADPADGRRTNVALDEKGRVAMNAIFDELAFEANSSQKANTECMVALGMKAAVRASAFLEHAFDNIAYKLSPGMGQGQTENVTPGFYLVCDQ